MFADIKNASSTIPIAARSKATATLEPETTTTQQSGQTPDKAVKIKNITVYVGGYTETDTTGMLSPRTVWRQQSEIVSSRQSGQILAAARIGFEYRCIGQNGCRFYTLRTGSFKLFKRPLPGFLTILTL